MFALLLLTACSPMHRVGKFLSPERYILAAEPRGVVAQVTVLSGDTGTTPGPYTAPAYGVVNGIPYERPMPITEDGWVEITPGERPYTVSLSVRHTSAFSTDFHPVYTLTGALGDEVPNELRLLPIDVPLTTPWRVTMKDLANVYEPTRLEDGDLLLLTVQDGEGSVEHYLFDETDFGLHARFGAGVLLRLPVPFVDDADADLSPTLAGTLALGYRPRHQGPAVDWAAEQLALVVSLGVGSTSVDVANPDLEQLQGAFNAALVGGGIELFQVVSGQVQVNVSAFGREKQESHIALAVGFDAVQFARFTQNVAERLLKRNALSPPR